jgi:hypothetical protein
VSHAQNTVPAAKSILVKVTIIVGALALAVASSLNAFVNAVPTVISGPLSVLVWQNPEAQRLQADLLLPQAGDPAVLKRIGILGRQALAISPLNSAALRQVGSADPDLTRASHLMALSQAVSRRDLATHLWFIEHAVQTSNLAQAVRHYDLALRVSDDSSKILFPILMNALEDPEIRSALKPYIRQGTPWLASFTGFVVAQNTNPVPTALAIEEAGGLPRTENYKDVESGLIGAVAANGRPDIARKIYQLNSTVGVDTLTSVTFDAASMDGRYAPITWLLADGDDASSTFMQDGTKGQPELIVEAGIGISAIAATKLLFLPPGRSFRFTATALSQSSNGTTMEWKLACTNVHGEKPIIALSLKNDLDHEELRQASFSLPANCPSQYLLLTIDTTRASQSVSLRIPSPDLTILR